MESWRGELEGRMKNEEWRILGGDWRLVIIGEEGGAAEVIVTDGCQVGLFGLAGGLVDWVD